MAKQCSKCGQSYDEHEVSCPHCSERAGQAAERERPSSRGREAMPPLQGTWGEAEPPEEDAPQGWVHEPQSGGEGPPLEAIEEPAAAGNEERQDHAETAGGVAVFEEISPAGEEATPALVTPSAMKKRKEQSAGRTASAWPGRIIATLVGAALGAAACFGVLWSRGLSSPPEPKIIYEEDRQTIEMVAQQLGSPPTRQAIQTALDGVKSLQAKAQERDAVADALKKAGAVSDAQPDLLKGVDSLVSSRRTAESERKRIEDENNRLTEFLAGLLPAVTDIANENNKLTEFLAALLPAVDEQMQLGAAAAAERARDRVNLEIATHLLKLCLAHGLPALARAGAALIELSSQRDAALARIERLTKEFEAFRREPVVPKPPIRDVPKPPTASEIARAGRALLDAGHPEEALRVLEQKPSDGKPTSELLLARGEARWQSYRRQHLRKQTKPSKDDKELREARAELNAAASAPALLLLGHIAEVLNDLKEARDAYERGLKTFAEDPRSQRLFQNALNNMDTRPKEIDLGTESQSRLTPSEMRQALVLAMVGLQPADADAEAPEEAGFAFFEAVNLADKHEYDKAIRRLREARQAHKKRAAFYNHRRLNPNSDRHEEIFSRCCLQLEAYWTMRARLREAGYPPPSLRESLAQQVDPLDRLAQDKKRGATLAAELKAALAKHRLNQPDPLEGLRTLLVQYEQTRETIQTLAENLSCPPKRSDLLSAVERLQAGACRPALELRDTLMAELRSAGFFNNHQRNLIEGLRSLVRDWKETKTRNEEFRTARQTALARQARAERERDAAQSRAEQAEKARRQESSARAQVEVEKKLESLARQKAEAANSVLQATVQAIAEKAGSQPTRTAILEALARLLQNRGPQQMLPIWQQMLEGRFSPALLSAAFADARQVATALSPAGPNVRGQALYVLALTLRQQGRVQEARPLLEEALRIETPDAPSSWRELAQQALEEMSSPVDYYLRRAGSVERLRDRLDILEVGLKEVPGDGRLLARRSLYRLEAALARRPSRPPERAEVEKARADAQAAVAAGARGEAQFVAGRAAEELGDGSAARKHYRQAVLDHSAADERGIRYRLALLRVLCRQLAAPSSSSSGVLTSPELNEAIRLADEAVSFGAAEGHLLKARIAYVRGQWTEALHEHALYLKQGVPWEYADFGRDLQAVLDNDPARQMPAAASRRLPRTAERQYHLARELYFRGDYAEAEKKFRLAVYHDDLDARSWYFLGLCEMRLGKSQLARDCFLRGAKLEEVNCPAPTDVYLSLERVQGAERQTLTRFRPKR